MARRLLLICGSLQKVSSNRAALDVVRDRAMHHADLVCIDADSVGSVPAFDPDLTDRPPQPVSSFRAAIGAADAVVISTPEYAAALPGALKNALDWVVGSGELYGKPVALISAGTTGGEFARQQLIRSLTWQGAHIVGHLGIAAPRTKSDASGRIVDPSTLTEVEALVDQVRGVLEMSAEKRLALVQQITEAAGVAPGHIAPVPEA